MKAAVWYGKEDIRYEDYPEPAISNDDQVKIRIKWCGICGTDVHEYRDGPLMIPKSPHPLTGHCGGPLILGHEYSGDVVEVGKGVTRVKVADRVTVNPLIYCGECHYCRRGKYNMCLKLATQGLAYDGAFAEYTVVEERMIVPLPDGMSYEEGAFAEPMAVAIRAVRRSRITVGDSVAVVGQTIPEYVDSHLEDLVGLKPPDGVIYLLLVDGNIEGMGAIRKLSDEIGKFFQLYFDDLTPEHLNLLADYEEWAKALESELAAHKENEGDECPLCVVEAELAEAKAEKLAKDNY